MSRHPNRGMQYANGQYVYYRTLPDYYPALAATVDVEFTAYMKEVTNLENISIQFGTMAAAELAKEMALINEKFGGGITGNYNDEGFAKKLIEAINKCLGMKSVFERNLALIKESSGGQKNVMSYFPTYFKNVWDQQAEIIYNETVAQFTGADTLTLDNVFADAVNQKLPMLVRQAVLNMMTKAGVETGIHKDRDKYKDAYKEMADAIQNNAAGTNEFIQAFIDNYHLQEIVEIIRQGSYELDNLVGKTNKSDFNVFAQVAQRGGLTMEEVRTYMENIIFEGLAAVTGSDSIRVNAQAMHTGQTRMKPDVITVLDIPFDELETWLNNSKFGNRKDNVQAALELQERLKQFDGGFITYTNGKNYTLNEGFKNGNSFRVAGFSAGEPIPLETFSSIMSTMGMAADKMVRSCMQLIPGAIGDDQMEAASTMMARAIATALFDDFNAVGVVETSGAKSIHLLDLNGVLLPLSFYLNLLSTSFADVASLPPDQLVTVQISTPGSVMYSKPAPHGMSQAYWSNQANAAINSIKVSWHFLAGFQAIMQQFT